MWCSLYDYEVCSERRSNVDGCGTMIYEVEDVDEEDEGECDA